jgi:tRNA threonylcarbamoyl adenosine modification protein YjeE
MPGDSPTERTVVLALPDEAATGRLGAWLAPRLGPGDAVLLSGGLGAGKTHLARSVIQARLASAGRHEDVPSPSFTLVQTYDTPGAEVWHADLYRLGDPAEVAELGLDDAFLSAVCLVEWPDRLGRAAPADALSVLLAPGPGGEGRAARLSGGPRWAERLAALEEAWTHG